MRFQKEISIYSKDAILKRFQASETNFSVLKGKIEALISESEILELQNSKVTMYSKLADVKFTVDGLSQEYTDISSKYDAVSGQYTDLDAKVAEYKQGVDGLSQTLTQVKSNLEDNYSTTTAMNAAIQAKIDGFSSTVSSTYAKGSDVTEKLTAADATAKGYADAAKQSAIDTAKKSTEELLESYTTVEKAQSMIDQKAESIESTVSSTYSKKGPVTQLEEWKKEASQKITDSAIISTVTNSGEWENITNFIQDTDGWQMNWGTLIDASDADSDTYKQYISFKNGNILLGHSNSKNKLKITNDSIQFKGTSDTAITPDSDATAWITGKVFHINSGEIESGLKFGNVKLKPSSNNTLIIRDPSDTKDMAEFGSTVRIGEVSGRNTQIDTAGLRVLNSHSVIAHIGYGPANDENNKHVYLPYYTFGSRKNESLIGGFSVAEGCNSTVSGYCAHAEGFNPIASGQASHAQGVNTVASGECSCAGGQGSKATGNFSCAIGNHVIAASASQTVIGKYNTQDASNAYSLIIGNGGSDTTRSNALTVGWGGDITAPRLTSKADLYFGFAGGNSFRPYYTKGNSASFKVWLMGYTTSGMTEVLFFMPFSRPIIGASGVSVSSVDGLIIRQNNKYLYGSTATVYVKPSSYTSEIVDGGQGVNIRAKMPNTTNVTNNTACAITASIKITFS